MSSFSSGGGGGIGSSSSKYEGYGSGSGSGGISGGSSLAKKYEAYSGDSKYYDSNAKELNNNNNNEKNDRYDKYEYNSKYRSDNDVKDKKEDKVLFYLKIVKFVACNFRSTSPDFRKLR